jgi:hypothetical protein
LAATIRSSSLFEASRCRYHPALSIVLEVVML